MQKEDLDLYLAQHPFAVLWEVIYTQLRNDILTTKLLPGDKMSEAKLARSFGISRTPIKMAINKLVEERLVEREEGKVPKVAFMGHDECYQLYEARKGLEGAAAYYAAKRITKQELEALKKLLDQCAQAEQDNNRGNFVKFDEEFHEIIVNASRNRFIIDMYKTLTNSLTRYRYQLMKILSVTSEQYLDGETTSHLGIYNALRQGLSSVAREEMEDNITRMYRTISSM